MLITGTVTWSVTSVAVIHITNASNPDKSRKNISHYLLYKCVLISCLFKWTQKKPPVWKCSLRSKACHLEQHTHSEWQTRTRQTGNTSYEQGQTHPGHQQKVSVQWRLLSDIKIPEGQSSARKYKWKWSVQREHVCTSRSCWEREVWPLHTEDPWINPPQNPPGV